MVVKGVASNVDMLVGRDQDGGVVSTQRDFVGQNTQATGHLDAGSKCFESTGKQGDYTVQKDGSLELKQKKVLIGWSCILVLGLVLVFRASHQVLLLRS